MKNTLFKKLPGLAKRLSGLLIFLIISFSAFSQNAGISPDGAIAPNTSSGLDVNFTDKGVLIPRVALTGTTSFAPLTVHVAGMVVYNTATTGDVTPGFYYNNGTKWIQGLPKGNSSGEMQYWDGTSWKAIPIGTPGQFLKLDPSGVPIWAP